ncbi:hypothetical protein HY968_02335 [Candidatus Kaiserbacteria bacterium]|nr:hypothetical protein [Candidatus Kaiserbacteria bacterium]
MTSVKNVIRYAILFAAVILFAGLLAKQSWSLYKAIFHESGGAWLDLGDIVGLMLNYIFLIPLMFVLFGERRKYILVIVFLIPILLFEWGSSSLFLMQDLVLAMLGFVIGLVSRFVATKILGKMPRFESWKKYF